MKPELKSDYLKAASLGVEIAVAVFLGAFIGYQVDRFYRSGPWGMTLGLVVGAIAGIWNAYKLAVKDDARA